MLFNEILDLKLITFVRDNPVLYDFNHVKYMDFNAREVAWQKIGDELKRPAADCKIRWINIRDVNRRILRKQLKDTDRPSRPYKYENELMFMRPFYKDVLAPGCEAGDRAYDEEWPEDCGEPPHDSDDAEKPVVKKAKTRKSAKKKKEPKYEEEHPAATSFSETPPEFDPADPVDAFLLSIGATLKTFSPYHLNVAKSKIFSVVQEHDLQQIVQKQQQDLPSEIKVTSESMFLS